MLYTSTKRLLHIINTRWKSTFFLPTREQRRRPGSSGADQGPAASTSDQGAEVISDRRAEATSDHRAEATNDQGAEAPADQGAEARVGEMQDDQGGGARMMTREEARGPGKRTTREDQGRGRRGIRTITRKRATSDDDDEVEA
ncbi:hypothetical protein Syun_028114 [Stephania yunnanensis]|uniref:Uncharacterized protein n=1 Tax=Stephania yunnanensis TaxID=152371 RepID=A0AAP0EP26_9MAGN